MVEKGFWDKWEKAGEHEKMELARHVAERIMETCSAMSNSYNKWIHCIASLIKIYLDSYRAYMVEILPGTSDYRVIDLCDCSLDDDMPEHEKLNKLLNMVTAFVHENYGVWLIPHEPKKIGRGIYLCRFGVKNNPRMCFDHYTYEVHLYYDGKCPCIKVIIDNINEVIPHINNGEE
ncbi:MAG: hypothetical protein GXO43_06040 [Crenarchaeota archaeon]|nr:hypothetical protein [Thermoproteota archaeon]